MGDAYTVRLAAEEDDMEAFVDVMQRAWDGMTEAETIPSHVFEAAKETGNLIGAFDEGEPVGFGYYLPDTTQDGHIHSHAVGVIDEMQGEGVGEAIKRKQREVALENGYDTIVWTYDPLLGGNAYLNVRKLGGTVSEYREDVYDTENETTAGETPADRFLVEWSIDDERVQQFLAGEERTYSDVERVLAVDDDDVSLDLDESAVERTGEDSYILPEDTNAEVVGVEIPRDLAVVKEAGTEGEWRYATRDVFEDLFDAGYAVVDFRTGSDDGFDHNTYILRSG